MGVGVCIGARIESGALHIIGEFFRLSGPTQHGRLRRRSSQQRCSRRHWRRRKQFRGGHYVPTQRERLQRRASRTRRTSRHWRIDVGVTELLHFSSLPSLLLRFFSLCMLHAWRAPSRQGRSSRAHAAVAFAPAFSCPCGAALRLLLSALLPPTRRESRVLSCETPAWALFGNYSYFLYCSASGAALILFFSYLFVS